MRSKLTEELIFLDLTARLLESGLTIKMVEDLISNKKVAFFTGCFANYYYPDIGKGMIGVLKQSGVKVIVPDQVCCGLPMIARGNAKGAQRNIEYNAKMLSTAAANGYAIITTCSSCSLFIKRGYKLHGDESARRVAHNTYHFSEYLLRLYDVGQMNTNFRYTLQTVFYQAPCHLRAQKIGQPTVEILQLIPGIIVRHISMECCGMGGAYGYEKANYNLAFEIGSRVFGEIKENPTDRLLTDCGGCKLQLEMGSAVEVQHPIILLQEAYSSG